MRVRNKPWAEEYIRSQEGLVVLNPSDYKGRWVEAFRETDKLALEIGCGFGRFITGMAEQYPETGFVAIELKKNVIVNAIERANLFESENIRFIHDNAEHLTDFFGESEFDELYLNFSDPWPKNRHEKRRLTHRNYLERYETILKPGGIITMKTDNRKLFEYSLESFSQFGMTLEDVTLDLHAEEDDSNVMTEYEEKFVSLGQPIYRCIVRNRKNI